MKKIFIIIYNCFISKRKERYSVFKSVYHTFFDKKIKCNGYFFISRKSKIIMKKGSRLLINGNLFLNHSYHDIFLNSIVILGNKATWKISGNTTINGACINLWKNALFESSTLKVNMMTKVNVQNKAVFGNNVMIARCCYVTDTNSHDIIISGNPIKKQKNLQIGNNVWIGANCNILRGTTIGDNVVVGAGTTLSGVIESHTLIRTNNIKSRKTIDTFVQ